LDNQLVQLGWKINAKYNVTLKGWTVQFFHVTISEESRKQYLVPYGDGGSPEKTLQAVYDGVNLTPCSLAEAIRSLPSGSEKSERQRIKRNVAAYKRVSADLKFSDSNPDGIKDPANYSEGTGSEITSVLERFMQGSDETVYNRMIEAKNLADDEKSYQKLNQAKWWSELDGEQQAIVRNAQSTPIKKKRR
jgi:hypothetical protein